MLRIVSFFLVRSWWLVFYNKSYDNFLSLSEFFLDILLDIFLDISSVLVLVMYVYYPTAFLAAAFAGEDALCLKVC